VPDHPHTESGRPKVRVNVMIDPELKQRAIATNVNFSKALEIGVNQALADLANHNATKKPPALD